MRGHESKIILFEAARELKRLGAVPLPTAEGMKAELAALNAKKEMLLCGLPFGIHRMSLLIIPAVVPSVAVSPCVH